MAGSVKHWRDKKNEIEKYVKPHIEKDFKHLSEAKFLFTFRHPPAYDTGDEKFVAGTARCIGNKERDTYGYDFEICIAAEIWERISITQKRRLMYHELCHCEVIFDEDNNPMRDEQGRLATMIEPHDINIRSFKKEIKKYGVDAQDVLSIKFLKRQLIRQVDDTFSDEDIML